jgi:hypothetical protein
VSLVEFSRKKLVKQGEEKVIKKKRKVVVFSYNPTLVVLYNCNN